MKKKFIGLFMFLFLLPVIVSAKEVSLKEFNYSKDTYEYFTAVTETLDGGYIATGSVDGVGVLVKFNGKDEVIWEKNFGVAYPFDIDIDNKGNIYVAGEANFDPDGGYSYENAIFKFDSNGESIKVYTHKKKLDGCPRSVSNEPCEEYDYFIYNDLEIKDDMVIAAGRKYDDVIGDAFSQDVSIGKDGHAAYVAILDKDLNLVKEAKFDYNDYEEFYGVTFTSDGGFIAVGKTWSTNIEGLTYKGQETNPIAVKYDKNGNLEWIYAYMLDDSFTEENSCYRGSRNAFNDVVENCDGNFVIVGSVSKLSKVKAPMDSSGWKKLEEVLGKNYKGLNLGAAAIEDEEFIEIETAAAAMFELDKNGKVVNEYIKDTEYDDTFTDILVLNNCSYVVGGSLGHEAAGRPMSLRDEKNNSSSQDRDENLGFSDFGCLNSGFDIYLDIVGEDFKSEWSKRYYGEYDDLLFNISSVGGKEFVAVGHFNSEDLKEIKLSEDNDGFVIRAKITYEINVEETKNGKLDAVNQHGVSDIVYHGDVATITTVPEEGYKVDTIKVVDSKGNEVPVTKVDNNKYEYKVTDDTWVTVTFKNVEVVIPPKTGVSTYLLLAVVVSAIGYVSYNLINKKNIFKKM